MKEERAAESLLFFGGKTVQDEGAKMRENAKSNLAGKKPECAKRQVF